MAGNASYPVEAGSDDGEGADRSELTPLRIVLVGVIPSIVIFMSIAGNVLVCVAIYTDRGLRRIGNLFLASLAIADLFVASLVMTFAVVNDLLEYWVFGPQFCDTWIAFDVMCSTASILNLCAISLDRYIHIKDPLRYGRWVTKKVAIAAIATIWVLAALISFLPISLGLHRPTNATWFTSQDGTKYDTCALDLTPVYAIVSSCISFYIPTIVMLGIYLRLYRYAQKHVQSIRAITKPFANSNYQSDEPHAIAAKLHAQNTGAYHVSDHKAAITVGIIMGVFLVCWVPFFCVNIVAAFCKTCIHKDIFKFLTWLGYSNSAFNPVIYSIFNTEFRQAFKRILTSHHGYCCFEYASVSSLPYKVGSNTSSLGSITDKGCCPAGQAIDRQINLSFLIDDGFRSRRNTENFQGERQTFDPKKNGSLSLKESSSAGSVRQVRVASTDKEVVASATMEASV